MSSTDFWYAVGDFFLWSFGILRVLGNNFNWFLIGVGFIMAGYWVSNLIRFSKEAKANGTIE